MVAKPSRKPRRVACSVGLILFFVAMPNVKTLGFADHDSDGGPEDNAQKVLSYHLDISRPSIAQPIKLTNSEKGSAYKFVQVEIADVENPKRHTLSFEVSYQPTGEKKIYLGSFSLYPADNPGKFLVATQGKLGSEGAIILTLVVPEKIETSDRISVTVKKIDLIKDG